MGMKSNSNHFKGTNGAKKYEEMRKHKLLLPLNLYMFGKLPPNDSQIMHMFRIDDGHLPNTAQNRSKIVDMTEEKSNYLGLNQYGNECYAKKIGKTQLWATVRNGIIQNCGLNSKEIPYIEGVGFVKNNKIKKVNK